MVRWSSELYIGDGIREQAETVRNDLRSGIYTQNAWLITLSTNSSNQLDIIHTLFVRQQWIRKSLPMVVGIAATKKEAMELIARILADSLQSHCGADMRAYLVEKHYTEQ